MDAPHLLLFFPFFDPPSFILHLFALLAGKKKLTCFLWAQEIKLRTNSSAKLGEGEKDKGKGERKPSQEIQKNLTPIDSLGGRRGPEKK